MKELIKEKRYKIEVQPGKKKERLDLFLTKSIENATRSRIHKLIEAELVKVNGKTVKAGYIVRPLDIIEAVIPVSPRPGSAEPEDIPLEIIYEDEYLLVVNKPAGMVAHPAFSNYTGTLVNALLHHTEKLSSSGTPGRPGIVHRLDKDTSGLLVVAKDDDIHARLAEQFARHTAEREYRAVCWGRFKKKEGIITSNIARSKSDRKKFTVSSTEGKKAVTHFEVIEEYDFTSYVKLKLETGRTHQIRVHLSSIGHPVFGDTAYGGRKLVSVPHTKSGSSLAKLKSRVENLFEIMKRQALHAKTLGFRHPYKKEFMRFDSELPGDMKELLKHL